MKYFGLIVLSLISVFYANVIVVNNTDINVAVKNAVNGDTILVEQGVYDNVIVSKDVTIASRFVYVKNSHYIYETSLNYLENNANCTLIGVSVNSINNNGLLVASNIYNKVFTSSGNILLTNSIIKNDNNDYSTIEGGATIVNSTIVNWVWATENSDVIIFNSILIGIWSTYPTSKVSAYNSLIKYQEDIVINGENILIGIDPEFYDASCILAKNSPCIDKGEYSVEVNGKKLYSSEYDFFGMSRIYKVDIGAVESSVVSGIVDNKIVANDFDLCRNYPNPFNPNTTIEFSLNNGSNVEITIYSILGKIVYKSSGYYNSGKNALVFNGSDLSSGTYIYTITYNNKVLSNKMTLIK